MLSFDQMNIERLTTIMSKSVLDAYTYQHLSFFNLPELFPSDAAKACFVTVSCQSAACHDLRCSFHLDFALAAQTGKMHLP